MSKRIATFQISDRNPVDPSDEEENYSNSSGGEMEERASEQELKQRKISKPRSLSQRNGMNKSSTPSFGNLFAGLPTNPFSSQSTKPAGNNDEDYDLKIRGLNKSFVESAQKLLERSPAADFSKLFQQYSKHLASFSVNLTGQSVEEKKPFIEPIAVKTTEKPFAVAPVVKTAEKIVVEPVKTAEKVVAEPVKTFEFSKPAEPFKSFEFTAKPVEAVKPVSVEPAKPVETPKPFEFKPMQFTPAVEVIKKEPEVIEVDESESEAENENETESEGEGESEKTESVAPKFSFNFGSAAAPVIEKTVEKTTEKVTETATFAPFSFGSTAAATSEPAKPFTFGSSTASASVSETPAFKPFSFGSTATSEPAKSFSFGATTTETVAPVTTSNVTSAASAVESSSTTPFKSFSFGSSSSSEAPKLNIAAPASNTFSFGATESKQVDSSAPKFSFGSSSIGGLAPLPTFSFGAPSTSGFSFTLPTAAAPSGKTGEQSDDGGDEIPPEEAESFSLTRTNTEQLKTGVGEENETSQHEERCKVFMMDATGSWIDLGVGIFKINRYNNETGKSRVLCRMEGSGKVILNALVSVPGMNVSSTEGKKEVALLAIGPEGKLVKYLIRVKTLEQAGQLKTAILNEIEYVKSSKNIN